MAEILAVSNNFSEEEQARRSETERLGTDSIVPLVLRLSLPAMVGLLVSSLYAFVDRIFIGNFVGELGLAAMNAAIPFMTFIFAFSILIGRGCSVIYSLALGRCDYDEAGKIFMQGMFLHLAVSLVLMTVGLSFLPQILMLFGAPELAIGHAAHYMSIALFGTPFAMILMQNHLIRAEGASAYAMVTQVVGALLNVFLDWVLMAGFDMGMRGAAIATVVSQAVSVSMVLWFFVRRSVIQIHLPNLRPTLGVVKRVLFNGATPFLFHFVAMLTWSIQNHMIQAYAVQSGHQVAAAMASFGIIMSLHILIMTPVLGLSMGMQPLIGYNIAAGRFRRVRKIFMVSIGLSMVLVMIPYLIVQGFAGGVIALFGSKGASLALGVYTLRRYVILMPLGSTTALFAHYFQGTGQAGKALLISFVRQVLFALPLMIFLPRFWGYDGIVFAFPIAEFFGMLFGVAIMAIELEKLKKLELGELAALKRQEFGFKALNHLLINHE